MGAIQAAVLIGTRLAAHEASCTPWLPCGTKRFRYLPVWEVSSSIVVSPISRLAAHEAACTAALLPSSAGYYESLSGLKLHLQVCRISESMLLASR